MKRILFVCLGNICRSSSAEEIMRTYIKRAGLEKEIEVDSAGISSYHPGMLIMTENCSSGLIKSVKNKSFHNKKIVIY